MPAGTDAPGRDDAGRAGKASNLNILMMAPEFPPVGGIGTRSYESARNLARMGHRVIVLTALPKGASKKAEYPGLEVINMPRLARLGTTSSLSFLATVLAYFFYGLYIIITRRISLCYGTIVNVGLSALLISKIYGTPYILAVHGMDIAGPSRIGRKWLKPVLSHAAAIVILAERQRQSLRQLGVPDDRIYLIFEGVDIEVYRPAAKDRRIMEQYNLTGKKVLLSVGRLIRRKAFDMVIKSFPEVLRQVPEAVYFVVGLGAEEPALKELAASLGLENRVFFPGYKVGEELRAYYSVGDVFIMTSREFGADIEGFGLVYLEANACGLPVIGGDSGGVSDAIANGVSGLLVDPESTAAITEAIVRLLSDEEAAKKLGRQGRERVEREFGYAAVAGKIQDMLDKAVPGGGPPR